MSIARHAGRSFLASVLLMVSMGLGMPLVTNAASNVVYFAVYCTQGGGLSTTYAADNVLTCHNGGAPPLFEAGVSSLTTNPNGAHFVTIVEADCYPDTSQVPHAPATPTGHINCGASPDATLTLGSTFPAMAPTLPPTVSPASLTPVSAGSLPKPQANQDTLDTILSIAFGIIGALALLMITISGLRYITSAGNPEKTAKAKNGIVYALVGLAVAISAEAIVNFGVSKL